MRQSQVDKLYAGLKDLSEERRGKLDERHRLFQLNREVDDLEQWIAEREVVAGSHELGQDYEHVTVSGTLFLRCLFSDTDPSLSILLAFYFITSPVLLAHSHLPNRLCFREAVIPQPFVLPKPRHLLGSQKSSTFTL